MNRRSSALLHSFLPPLLLSLLLMSLSLIPSLASAKTEKPAHSSEDAAFLAEIERRAFQFFRDQAHPRTGLVKDRASNFGRDDYHIASMAATGFGLSALVIGAKRGYISRDDAYRRALRHLQFAAKMPHERGWFYHFVEWHNGRRAWNCELSSIDTALWLAGALAAGAYFKGTEVDRLAQRLYRRIDFNWMRTDAGAKPDELTLSMGWTPERGFIRARWNEYSEHLILNLLALSSPTHPIPAESWDAWVRDPYPVGPYAPLGGDLPLFVHQYSHAFVNFRGRRADDGVDYWENSVIATQANRWFCTNLERAEEFGFGPNEWGLSAVDGPDGYRAYGLVPRDVDGTLSPIGVAAAMPFLPEVCLETLKAMKQKHGERIWGKYSFAAYNQKRDWVQPDMIGIDAGAALLLLDRYRFSEAVIPSLLERTVLWRGLQRAGFRRIAPTD